MVILLYGVSGSGKTTIGTALAARLTCRFIDADDYHPPANRAKMQAGTPLDDTDRAPWLASLRVLIDEIIASGEMAVLACSALKATYRTQLGVDQKNVRSVLLMGQADLIADRLASRTHAFMNKQLLRSQLSALEPGVDGLVFDVAASPGEICEQIVKAFDLADPR